MNNQDVRANSTRELIRTMAMSMWGSTNLRRVHEKPENYRFHCPCGTVRALLRPSQLAIIIDLQDPDMNFDVRMSLCSCGRVNYYVEWHDEDELFKKEQQALIKICDDVLEDLS